MKPIYTKATAFFIFSLAFGSMLTYAQTSTAYFNLQACNANMVTGSQMDYNEFTAQIDNSECVSLNVVGDNLYRNNPTSNPHSCTPGVNGSVAMCVGSNTSCNFTPNSDQAIRIDITVTPGASGSASLSELSFYEQGPAEFNRINGDSGPNNFPTLFGVRVVKNGTQVFLSAGLP